MSDSERDPDQYDPFKKKRATLDDTDTLGKLTASVFSRYEGGFADQETMDTFKMLSAHKQLFLDKLTRFEEFMVGAKQMMDQQKDKRP